MGSHLNIQSHSYSADIDIYDMILDSFTRDAKRKKKSKDNTVSKGIFGIHHVTAITGDPQRNIFLC